MTYKNIFEKVESNAFLEAIELLFPEIDDKEVLNTLSIYRSRINKIKSEKREGTIRSDEFDLEWNKIRSSLLGTINEMNIPFKLENHEDSREESDTEQDGKKESLNTQTTQQKEGNLSKNERSMTTAELRYLYDSLKVDDLIITFDLLERISESLRFSASIDPSFIFEVNLFVHLLFKKLSKVDYYGEIEDDMERICNLSLSLAENLKVIFAKPKEKRVIPPKLIEKIKYVGKLLERVAPHIRTITGILTIIHQSDIHFFN